jgi:hypothetical protein
VSIQILTDIISPVGCGYTQRRDASLIRGIDVGATTFHKIGHSFRIPLMRRAQQRGLTTKRALLVHLDRSAFVIQ